MPIPTGCILPRTAMPIGRTSRATAQIQLWDDTARLVDEKWTRVLGEVWPAVARGIAQHL